jgi:hypothetical protein
MDKHVKRQRVKMALRLSRNEQTSLFFLGQRPLFTLNSKISRNDYGGLCSNKQFVSETGNHISKLNSNYGLGCERRAFVRT